MKIEKSIPIPALKSGKLNIFKQMKSGDSILIPEKEVNAWRMIAWRKKIKIATRRVSKDEYRVWKV